MSERYKYSTKSGGLLGATWETTITDTETGRWVTGGGKDKNESVQNAEKRRREKGW